MHLVVRAACLMLFASADNSIAESDDPVDPVAMQHAVVDMMRWAYSKSYLPLAFPKDELVPSQSQGTNSFGGKGLTIIDSLDTLSVHNTNRPNVARTNP
jgi:hypothetical protein